MKKVFREDQDSLICGECQNVFHHVCAGVSGDDMKVYKSLFEGFKLKWLCPGCDKKKKSVTRSGSKNEAPEGVSVADFGEMKMGIRRMEEKFDSLMQKLNFIASDVASLCKKYDAVNEKVVDLEDWVDDLAFHNDHKEIEIKFNMDIRQDEKKIDLTLDVIRSSLGVPVDIFDIDQCYLIKWKTGYGFATGSSHTAPNQSLVVKLTTGRMRDEIMGAWRTKRKSGGVYYQKGESTVRLLFQERLSKRGRALFNSAKNLSKEMGWKFLWIKRGKIHVRRTEGERYHLIHSEKDLSSLK